MGRWVRGHTVIVWSRFLLPNPNHTMPVKTKESITVKKMQRKYTRSWAENSSQLGLRLGLGLGLRLGKFSRLTQ